MFAPTGVTQTCGVSRASYMPARTCDRSCCSVPLFSRLFVTAALVPTAESDVFVEHSLRGIHTPAFSSAVDAMLISSQPARITLTPSRVQLYNRYSCFEGDDICLRVCGCGIAERVKTTFYSLINIAADFDVCSAAIGLDAGPFTALESVLPYQHPVRFAKGGSGEAQRPNTLR